MTKLASAAFDLAASLLWGAKAADKDKEKAQPKIGPAKLAEAVEALDDPQREVSSLCFPSLVFPPSCVNPKP